MPEIKDKKKLITLPEVMDFLKKLDKETADQIQRRTLDYTSKFSKTSLKDAKNIRRKLVKEAKLTEKEAVELTNVMPKSKEELRVFASGWKKLIPDEVLENILTILEGSSD